MKTRTKPNSAASTLAVANDLTPEFGGRLYPLSRRTRDLPKKAPPKDVFDQIAADLADRLTPRGESAVTLAGSFARKLTVFRDTVEDLNKFLLAGSIASGFQNAPGSMKTPAFPSPGIELYDQSTEEARADLRTIAVNVANETVANFKDALDEQVEQRQMGLIAWQSETSCRFYHYGFKIHKSQTGARTSTSTSSNDTAFGTEHTTTHYTEKDMQAIHRVSLKVEDLLEAKSEGLSDTRVERPQRVRIYEKSIPDLLRDYLLCVSGQQIREILVEMDVKTETWTETDARTEKRWVPKPPQILTVDRFDPALTLGHYVLVAWDEGEMHGDKEKLFLRQQQADQTRTEKAVATRNEAMHDLSKIGLAIWVVIALVIAGFVNHGRDKIEFQDNPGHQQVVRSYEAAMARYQNLSGWTKFWGNHHQPSNPDTPRYWLYGLLFAGYFVLYAVAGGVIVYLGTFPVVYLSFAAYWLVRDFRTTRKPRQAMQPKKQNGMEL